MKEYKYTGFTEAIKIDDECNITYKGKEVEKFYYNYNAMGCPMRSYRDLMKCHYIDEMKRIDAEIKTEQCRENFKNCETAEESIDYFLSIVNEEV